MEHSAIKCGGYTAAQSSWGQVDDQLTWDMHFIVYALKLSYSSSHPSLQMFVQSDHTAKTWTSLRAPKSHHGLEEPRSGAYSRNSVVIANGLVILRESVRCVTPLRFS